jgi:hypothetical protein
MRDHAENHEHTSAVTVHRGVPERSVNVRQTRLRRRQGDPFAGWCLWSIRSTIKSEISAHGAFGSKDPSERHRRRVRARVTTLLNETDS